MGAFGIGFGELDGIVRVMHGIDPGNAALVARFKYMQRLGFPEGINSGRGVRSVYGLEEVLKVLLAVELLEAGATPTRVVRMIRTGWKELRSALALGWLAATSPALREHRLLIGSVLSGLSELGQEDDPGAPIREPLKPMTLADITDWLSAQDLPASAAEVRRSVEPRRLLIDPMRIAAALRALVPELTAMEAEELDQAYMMLGEDAFEGSPQAEWPLAAAR